MQYITALVAVCCVLRSASTARAQRAACGEAARRHVLSAFRLRGRTPAANCRSMIADALSSSLVRADPGLLWSQHLAPRVDVGVFVAPLDVRCACPLAGRSASALAHPLPSRSLPAFVFRPCRPPPVFPGFASHCPFVRLLSNTLGPCGASGLGYPHRSAHRGWWAPARSSHVCTSNSCFGECCRRVGLLYRQLSPYFLALFSLGRQPSARCGLLSLVFG
jgi:hypothetical protein